jgi:DNA-binding NarL/FixJ family response regulator
MRPNTGDRGVPPTGEINGKTGRIMILDDHVVFRQALAVMLEHRAGFEVYADIASPEEASAALEGLNGRLDLAVVDLDLPDGGAEEFIRELGERASGATVLGLTAGRDHAARKWGTSEVLTTGVCVDDILAAARQLVG